MAAFHSRQVPKPPSCSCTPLKWIRQNMKTFSKPAINSEKSRFSASKCGRASRPPLGTLSSQAGQRMSKQLGNLNSLPKEGIFKVKTKSQLN